MTQEFSLFPDAPNNIRRTNPTTVRAELHKRGAYCRDGKLYDREGRRLYFVREIDRIGFAGTLREAFPGQLEAWRKERDKELAEQLRQEPGVVIRMWPMDLPH
jgi:hypothetical protein